jgi:hypothetical protein
MRHVARLSAGGTCRESCPHGRRPRRNPRRRWMAGRVSAIHTETGLAATVVRPFLRVPRVVDGGLDKFSGWKEPVRGSEVRTYCALRAYCRHSLVVLFF